MASICTQAFDYPLDFWFFIEFRTVNLVLDLGNTWHKYAVFESDELVFQNTVAKLKVSDLQLILDKFQIKATIFSSVDEHDPEIETLLSDLKNSVFLSHITPLPIHNNYLSPETLGNDRLASAVGGNMYYPDKDVLCIDAGTCIKYDFINSLNQYCGGAISPGLSMRLMAMHNFTARLPLINPLSLNNNTPFKLIGGSTSDSMLSGTYNGALAEVEGMIDKYSSQYSNLTVLITGGDSPFFELHVKRRIFARPNLVLEGLNRILNFNLNNF